MKTIRAVGFGLALAVASASAAEARQVAGFDARELFEQLDANKDKVLEKSEVPESARPSFDQLLQDGDTNKNGKLELDEYRALLKLMAGTPAAPTRPAPAGPGEDRFAAMDTNGDGKLGKAEFQGGDVLFERIDTDKDGYISRAEAFKFFAANQAERLKAMDKDGDGKVSKKEFTGPDAQFARLDADKDGFITKDEVAKLQAANAAVPGPFFQAMDANGDGKITRDEFTGPKPRFDRLDVNKDGALSLEEFRAGLRPDGAEPKKGDAQK